MNIRLLVFVLLLILATGGQGWALSCTNCGVDVVAGAKFCGQCGRPLPGTEAALAAAETGDSSLNLVAPPSPQAYQVTSYYLLVDGFQVVRKSFFWIAEIKNERARIWCVNEPPVYGLIMGWVKLAELEKRSTWRADAITYCVEPPPPTAQIVVVERRQYWRNWRPRAFIYAKPGRRH
jgi:hypothetical protein